MSAKAGRPSPGNKPPAPKQEPMQKPSSPPPAWTVTTTTQEVLGQMAPLLNSDEAAFLLGLSGRTLEAWRSRKKGPPYVKLHGAVRYRRTDLEEYVAINVHPLETTTT